MVKKQKTKKPPVATKKRNTGTKKVALASRRLRHFKLVDHTLTGKLVPHHHTSHLALIVMLLFVGVVLLMTGNFSYAIPISSSSTIAIGLTVPGPPPSQGASITSPRNQTQVTTPVVSLSGTCEPSTLVVIYNNGRSVGSTSCTSGGIFAIEIQVSDGENALQALNYDQLNQSGPATATIIVKLTRSAQSITPGVIVIPQRAKPLRSEYLVTPAIMSVNQASAVPCDQPHAVTTPTGASLSVQVVCIVRGITPGTISHLGILVQGGIAPYALNINWGYTANKDTLLSITQAGYQLVPFKYDAPGIFPIKLSLNDKNDGSAFTQVIAEVNGVVTTNLAADMKNTLFSPSWFETPVPLYIAALTLTSGFWVGDVFDQRFGNHRSSRRIART